MRFGQQLKQSLNKQWLFYYIDYEGLKGSLRAHRVWDDATEQEFIRQLEKELDKVYTFQRVKSEEIIRRIAASDKEVNDAVVRAQQQTDGSADAFDDDFELLEEDLSDVIADVHDLAKFTQLNYTGFQKIIKKHDKNTSWGLKPVFAARLKHKPFFQDNYDSYVVKLSRLYDIVRTRGNPVKGDSSAGGKQQNFVRQTTKYWVHPDNIVELKLIVLKHLPVLVFNANKEFNEEDSAITSIYYDNTDTWELYQGRLKKTEGAEAIRLRWYGGMSSDTIFIERKTHREDWTGEESVKARFKLKEKNVNAFMRGELTPEKVFEKERREQKRPEKDIASDEQLAREIQYRVLTRSLVPVTRSFYHRTAFQLPGDARVRISLDTELTMTREDNLDGKKRAGSNWRRMDIGVDWPFKQLPAEDKEMFPYAVLEVKLQTQAGGEPPQWIRDLTSSHLVEAVPKFSKYIHGTATLNPSRINLIPYWYPQMDVDIRKPVSHKFGIERPGASNDISTSGNLDDDDSEDDDAVMGLPYADGNHDDDQLRRLREARDVMEENEIARTRAYGTITNANDPNTLDIEERVAAGRNRSDDYPIYDSDSEDEDDDFEEAKRAGGLRYARKWVERKTVSVGSALMNGFVAIVPKPTPTDVGEGGFSSKPVGEIKRFKAPKGKRIHVPVRVEPKVQLATERTFLSWLEFSILIGSIAATLLNFGDGIAFAAAWAFTIIACLALIYSAGLYLWRVRMIKSRRAVVYHDKWGPTLLCVGLFCAVALSFGFRFGKGGYEGGLKG
ncbi:SPX-domain-containing protein [Dothidotthia symphoricarpi CBS 119687]|uniref:Vacuolar transporter chaperone complex subunit 4 n=1 Tax=Dothidotthia symphoricarpi CBS 119687 TaxID=1392245 RepID=A0A6A6AVN4_9PLEO|nr:SPX-domain-containing protein [Dothidotthia symphoricarpi CBS 119687]KAF2135025.1 SPX-domain-containing protein [Dothidotthia symphoricarpi CBS 119687]